MSTANAQGWYAPRWVYCSDEYGYCNAPPGAVIRYGAYGRFTEQRSPYGGLPCNNAVFGDPAFGAVKQCFFLAR